MHDTNFYDALFTFAMFAGTALCIWAFLKGLGSWK
jgi:hypothetical protein